MRRMDYAELIERLQGVKEKGYIPTHRYGDTGIGKTLEDLVGIEENNIPGPDANKLELKSARAGGCSMLTLFTKQPLPRKVALSTLINQFGYPSEKNGEKILHTTIKANAFTNIKGRKSLTVRVNDKIELVSAEGATLGFWNDDILRPAFEKKLPALLFVKALAEGKRPNERFWFNEAWYLKGFSFENFKRVVSEGIVCIDLRIGQYSDGRPHDHGTGFRIKKDRLEACFATQKRIM
jgi:hypothetical protein